METCTSTLLHKWQLSEYDSFLICSIRSKRIMKFPALLYCSMCDCCQEWGYRCFESFDHHLAQQPHPADQSAVLWNKVCLGDKFLHDPPTAYWISEWFRRMGRSLMFFGLQVYSRSCIILGFKAVSEIFYANSFLSHENQSWALSWELAEDRSKKAAESACRSIEVINNLETD